MRLGLRGFAKDKEFTEALTCLLMFLLGLTSPWGLICCKMGQLNQRQRQREQNLLLDPGELELLLGSPAVLERDLAQKGAVV